MPCGLHSTLLSNRGMITLSRLYKTGNHVVVLAMYATWEVTFMVAVSLITVLKVGHNSIQQLP